MTILRQHATSLLLLALALGAGLYAWRVERGAVTSSERSLRTGHLFAVFRREDLTRLEVTEHAAGSNYVLERVDAGTWRLAGIGPADVASVDRLLQELEAAEPVRKASSFGPVRARLTLTMGPLVLRLVLGGPAPQPEGAAYAQVEGEGEARFVISRALVTRLLEPSDSYRERSLMSQDVADVVRLEVTRDDGAFAVERVDSVDFALVSSKRRASRRALGAVWSALFGARAEGFLDEAAATSLTKTPSARAVLSFRDGTRTEFVVGAPCPGLADDLATLVQTGSERAAVCLPKGLLDALGVKEATLLDGRLLSAYEDEVAEVSVRRVDGGVLDLAREGTGWKQRAPMVRTLAPDEAESARAWVTSLTRAEGELVDAGAETVSGFVTVRRALGQGQEELEVVQRADGTGLVRRRADGVWVSVSREVLRGLLPRAVAVRGTALFSEPVDAAAVVGLRTSCNGVEQHLVYDGSWNLKEPSGYRADAAAAFELVNAVARAKADVWVADNDDGSFGFSTCRVGLEMRADAGGRRVDLVFGARTEGGVFVRVADGAVGVMPKGVSELASRWLVDRSGFRVERPETLTLVRGATRTVLRRGDGGLERFDETLGQLFADEVVHLGPPQAAEGFESPVLRVDATSPVSAVRFAVGLRTTRNHEKVYFARIDGIAATFTLPREPVETLLGLFP
ncbi:MAG: hypothetical protein WCI05_09790 [Myxococcales bacterium]